MAGDRVESHWPGSGDPASRLRTAIAFVPLYLLLDWISYIHPVQHSSITPWNPQPALAIALLALRGQRWLPVVFLAIVGSEVVVRGAAAGWLALLLVPLVLSCGYAAIAATLAGSIDLRDGVRNRSEMVRLVAIVAIGSFLTGTLYVGATWASGAPFHGPYVEALLQFWIGDCVGIMVTLPVLLSLYAPARRLEAREMLQNRQIWLQYATIGMTLWLVFGPVFDDPFKFFYLLFLPLIWVAARFGLVGASFATLSIQMGVILAVQFVPFASLTVFELQALLIALAVTGLFLGVIVDERRQAADELRESLRLAAAGEMSAALAHELNQPLTALTNYARAGVLMAQQPGTDPSQIRETLEKITIEASRAADVVRRLRDFFRTGSTSLRVESIEDVIASGIRAAQSAADAAGVRLERVIATEIPKVLIDRLQIELVVKNLIANAIQALAGVNDPRLVRLVAERIPGDVVRITVIDSGPGVPADVGERVFEPFWSSRATGMGMGLAISRAIVEAHGGRLWTETGSSGTFVFTLPLAHG